MRIEKTQLEKTHNNHYIFSMKNRTIPIIFGVISVVLAGSFFAIKKIGKEKDNSLTRAKIITPKSSQTKESEAEMQGTSLSLEKYETFVPLLPGETLISTLTFDFNNDGYDDEVIIVKNTRSPFLIIVPGLFDSNSGNYERLSPIETNFSRTRAFSYLGIDLVGEHKNSLVYQGIDDDGNYVLKAFYFQTKIEKFEEKNEFVNIGDFSSDGTVFIQQTERSESYSLGLSNGESFSIWVYKSEIPENENNQNKEISKLNQIQQEFRWNKTTNQYELYQEIKVTAGRVTANALSRIQDGTVETFAKFLNGLWYKTSNSDGNVRYIYFDYASKEIILFITDTQEVYEWEDSKVRHNGIYLTTVNADIINLHRRFDISLVNIDEIRMTIRDDINLIIKETSLWDGQYKKLSSQKSFFNTKEISDLSVFSQELKKGSSWTTADEQFSISFDDYNYTIKNPDFTETGIYSLCSVGNKCIIQFRSDLEESSLLELYSLDFGQKIVTEQVKRKTVEKLITDYDTIIFSPVKITPTEWFPSEGYSFTFIRKN